VTGKTCDPCAERFLFDMVADPFEMRPRKYEDYSGRGNSWYDDGVVLLEEAVFFWCHENSVHYEDQIDMSLLTSEAHHSLVHHNHHNHHHHSNNNGGKRYAECSKKPATGEMYVAPPSKRGANNNNNNNNNIADTATSDESVSSGGTDSTISTGDHTIMRNGKVVKLEKETIVNTKKLRDRTTVLFESSTGSSDAEKKREEMEKAKAAAAAALKANRNQGLAVESSSSDSESVGGGKMPWWKMQLEKQKKAKTIS
jgi:hypothetical protein